MRIWFQHSDITVYEYRFLQKMVEAGLEVVQVVIHPERDTHGGYYWERCCELPIRQELIYPRYTSRGVPTMLSKLDYVRQMRALLCHEQPDVLHGCWVTGDGFYCALTGYRPFLLMAYGSDVLLEPDASWWGYRKARYAIRRADLLTCDSEYQKRAVMKVGGRPAEDITTFPWGIELDLYQPRPDRSLRQKLGWADDDIVLIMNRGFRPLYGHRFFAAAFVRLAERFPKLCLVLLHDGPERERICAELDRAGLSDRYHYGGMTGPDEMVTYLNNSDIYVSCSLSDGTSSSMLEAMACGLPVVVSDIPVNDEWVEPGVNGSITPRKDVDALERALAELIESETMRKKMGENNIRLARERADWDINFEKLMAMYRTLAGKGENNG